MNITYKSELYTMSGSQSDKRDTRLAFLPEYGPRRGRTVISRFLIKLDWAGDTGGESTVAAGGWANLLKSFRVADAQGDLVNLSGPELRALHYLEEGRNAIPDPALLAISQTNATRTCWLVYNCAPRRRGRRRWDTAIPADVLYAGGRIEFETNGQSSIGTGGVTTDTLNVQIFAECREEMDIQIHARRETRSFTFNNLTDLYIKANGGLVRNAFAFKYADHITGGTDLSSCTAVTIEAIGLQTMPPAVLQQQFLQSQEANYSSSNDPFVVGTRAIPLLYCDQDGKITDMVLHNSEMLTRLEGNTVSQLPIVCDLITRQTMLSSMAEQMKAGGGAVKIKTEGKSKSNPAAWNFLEQYMPKKVVKSAT